MVPSTTESATDGQPLSPELFLDCNPVLLTAARILVAFSGGMDSSVLLHLLAQLRDQGLLQADLAALHVNHGIHRDASAWEQHCREFCQLFNVPLMAVQTQVRSSPGYSMEMAARDARYRAFNEHLGPGELLLQAHHRDDQAETLLYRLLRGSGPQGLGAMPAARILGKGELVRPLLAFRRHDIQEYASRSSLHWIDDPSNSDMQHDRNFLRHRVLPLLQERWPQAAAGLARSAALSAESAQLLAQLAQIDMDQLCVPPGNRLDTRTLHEFDEARQRNLLRYWLQHCASLFSVPQQVSNRLLQALRHTLVGAVQDAQPEIRWGKDENRLMIRRYRHLLYVLPSMPDTEPMVWNTSCPLALPAPLGELQLQTVAGPGLPRAELHQLEVRFRAGGEIVKAPGRPGRSMKKILQDCQVPPWLREHVPLLYRGSELVAVGDLVVSENWWRTEGENHCRLLWQRSDLHCGY